MNKENLTPNENGTLFTLNEAAKLLRFMGRNTLMEWLRERKLLLKNNLPAQDMIDSGYMVYREKTVQKNGVRKRSTPVTLVTFKGLDALRKMLRRELLKNPIINTSSMR